MAKNRAESPGGVERDVNEVLDERLMRHNEYYRHHDKAEDLADAEKDKKRKGETQEVRGLCADCSALRYIKTKLGVRDQYWCARPEVRSRLPGGIMEIGDEITTCPWYMPRQKPGEMDLRTMFTKAVFINLKTYDPGSKDDQERGVVYL